MFAHPEGLSHSSDIHIRAARMHLDYCDRTNYNASALEEIASRIFRNKLA
jgi:hypothetical protein